MSRFTSHQLLHFSRFTTQASGTLHSIFTATTVHLLSTQSITVDLNQNQADYINASMNTDSSSDDSACGPNREAELNDQQIESILTTADFGEGLANENFQADSQYHIPTPHFNSPEEVVPMQEEVIPIPQAAASQDHPDGYISFLNLWYDIANGPDGGAHYLRQIRWHHPRPAPAAIPQWPAAPVARAAVDGDPDGYNPTLKIWYDMATAQAPGADFFREIGWHTVVSAPGGMPQEAATPITAPVARPQLPTYRPAPAAARPTPARALKGRNPKKNSIIQKCICKSQYSTIDVPRPPNMFILFRSQESMKIQRDSVRSGGVKITHDKISKIVGERWHAMSDAARAPYKAQADRLAEEHKIKYPGWSFKPGMKNAHQFGSMSCTCGAYQINVAAREKRAEQAAAYGNSDVKVPFKKRSRGPGRKRKQRESDDESEDEQPTSKRSTRSKTPVRYAEEDDENDSLFMEQSGEIMDAPAEDEYDVPVLGMPSKGRRSPPAPIMTMPASPSLTRSAGKEPTPLKTSDFNDLFAEILDYSAPFDIPTSARSSKKSSAKESIAPVTPRRSTRLSSREAL